MPRLDPAPAASRGRDALEIDRPGPESGEDPTGMRPTPLRHGRGAQGRVQPYAGLVEAEPSGCGRPGGPLVRESACAARRDAGIVVGSSPRRLRAARPAL